MARDRVSYAALADRISAASFRSSSQTTIAIRFPQKPVRRHHKMLPRGATAAPQLDFQVRGLSNHI
jgi:hypothetical protein